MNILGDHIDLVMGIAPLDLQTARVGDWVSLKNAGGISFVIVKGVGTDNDDPVFTVQQATSVAGGSAKDLVAIETIYHKMAVDMTTLGAWTKVTQTALATWTPGDPAAQSQMLAVIPIDASKLDIANGFDCVNISCSDVGSNAQLGCVLYVLHTLRYKEDPQNLPNSIID